MALPVNTDLTGLDFVFNGNPFVMCPAKSDIAFEGLDFVFNGQPFVSNPVEVTEETYYDNAIMFGMMF